MKKDPHFQLFNSFLNRWNGFVLLAHGLNHGLCEGYCWLFEVCGLRVKGYGANGHALGLATAFVGRIDNVGGRIENAGGGTDNVRGGNEKLGGLL